MTCTVSIHMTQNMKWCEYITMIYSISGYENVLFYKQKQKCYYIWQTKESVTVFPFQPMFSLFWWNFDTVKSSCQCNKTSKISQLKKRKNFYTNITFYFKTIQTQLLVIVTLTYDTATSKYSLCIGIVSQPYITFGSLWFKLTSN